MVTKRTKLLPAVPVAHQDVLQKEVIKKEGTNVWFADKKRTWYNKYSDEVTEEGFSQLVHDFDNKLIIHRIVLTLPQ